MNPSRAIRTAICLAAWPLLTLAVHGCKSSCRDPAIHEGAAPASLGTLTDPIWQNQETGGESSDFVIYQHEFELNTARLNLAGQDHVKQVAARLSAGQDMPVIVERSMTGVRRGTEFEFPVHANPALDLRRREVVVLSLAAMGIPDADHRVVVAPAIAEGFMATEAQRAYEQGLGQGASGFTAGRGYGGTGLGGFVGSGAGFY